MTTKSMAYLMCRVRVENANAVSSAITHGIPAITHFLGAAHRIQRELQQEGKEITLNGVGVVIHGAEEQSTDTGYNRLRFNLMRNPVDSDGKPGSMVEYGRIHFEATLIIGLHGDFLSKADLTSLAQDCMHRLLGMRIAGGSVYATSHKPSIVMSGSTYIKKIKYRLLPGFALISRTRLHEQHFEKMKQEKPETTPLDALLDLCALHSEPQKTALEENTQEVQDGAKKTDAPKVEWRTFRREKGWLVPIPIGFVGISKLYHAGEMNGARDSETPFRFVEAAVSLGEFISPHRVESLDELLWHYEADAERGAYFCFNHNSWNA